MDWSGIKTKPPPWEAKEHPPETLHDTIWLVKIILINYEFHNFYVSTNISRRLKTDGVWEKYTLNTCEGKYELI